MVFLALTDYRSEVELQFCSMRRRTAFPVCFCSTVVETPELVSLLGTIETPVVLVNRYLRSMDTDIVSVDNYRVRVCRYGLPNSKRTCQNWAFCRPNKAPLPVKTGPVDYLMP